MSVRELLERRHVPFEVVEHDSACGAQHVAQALHVPGHEVAKSVLLRSNHDYHYFVAVLPATHRIDFDELATFLNGTQLELAGEEEIARICPHCERGVLPPFGTQYGAQTIVDKSLTGDDCICFETDCHTSVVRMKFADFYAVEHPLIARFAHPAHG